MTTTTTNTQVELDHPYWGAGVVSVILSFGVLAFSLGVLDRCGGGSGICLSPSSHPSGDAGLILFVILFIVGIGLIVATGTGAMRTQITSRDPTTPPAVSSVDQRLPRGGRRPDHGGHHPPALSVARILRTAAAGRLPARTPVTPSGASARNEAAPGPAGWWSGGSPPLRGDRPRDRDAGRFRPRRRPAAAGAPPKYGGGP